MSDRRRPSAKSPERPTGPALDRRAFGEPMRTASLHTSAGDPFVPERGRAAGDLRPRPRPVPEGGR